MLRQLRCLASCLQVTKVDLQRVRNVKAIMNKLMNRVGRIKSVSDAHVWHLVACPAEQHQWGLLEFDLTSTYAQAG